jgi:hypothetical protein
MKGLLFKQYNIWKIEYEQTNGKKVVKKEIELHPADIYQIDDDGEYANNFEFREVFFEMTIISDKINSTKVVAKLIEKEIPNIKIDKNNDDNE